MKVSQLFPQRFPYTPESFLFFLCNVAHAEMETFTASPLQTKGIIVSSTGNFQAKVSTPGNNLFPDCFPESFHGGMI